MNKRRKKKENNIIRGIGPEIRCFTEPTGLFYVSPVLMNLLSRDLYRAAVFFLIIPSWTDLSKIDWTSGYNFNASSWDFAFLIFFIASFNFFFLARFARYLRRAFRIFLRTLLALFFIAIADYIQIKTEVNNKVNYFDNRRLINFSISTAKNTMLDNPIHNSNSDIVRYWVLNIGCKNGI